MMFFYTKDEEREFDRNRQEIPDCESQTYRTLRSLNRLRDVEQEYTREDNWN